MKDSYAVLIAVGLGIIFATTLAVPIVMSGYSGITGGQTSGPFFGGGMMTTQGQSISIDQAIQMMKSVPQYANVITSNNTIIFSSSSQSIRVVALATDHEGATNLTTNTPPNYATDDLFVIYGLIDPTLVIPHGASVQITVVNLDKDMYHNFVFTTLNPPYSYMAMMQGMMMGNWQQRGTWLAMMPFLPPANYSQGVVHEYTYTVTLNSQGTLSYLCTYPGHAQDGMYGRMLVT